MVDYGSLKPGAYLVQGDHVKSLSLLDSAGWGIFGGANAGDSVSALAKSIGWYYAALRERQDQIVQTPFKWMQNGKDMDRAPFKLNAYELARIEKGLTLFNNVYYHKSTGRGSRASSLVSLAWLNPANVYPDKGKVVNLHTGYTEYIRVTQNTETGSDNEQRISADELLRFELQDMEELYSNASAGRAVRGKAAVIKAVQALEDHQFDKNNGLPIMLVVVPEKYRSQQEKLAGRFRSLFNRRSQMYGDNKTVGVPEGVTVKQLSLTPNEMRLTESDRAAAEAVIIGLGVPLSKAFGASNYATKRGENQEFALKMAHRLKWIADVINDDPDMQAQRIELVVDPDKVAFNLDDEQKRVDMVVSLVAAGESIANAYLLAGIKLPDEYVVPQEPDPIPATPTVQEQAERVVNDTEPLVDEEIKRLQNFNRKKRSRGFESEILSDGLIELYSGMVYP